MSHIHYYIEDSRKGYTCTQCGLHIPGNMFGPALNAGAEFAPLAVLNQVCHTSQRIADGTVYTLSDSRFSWLNGRQIRSSLEQGKTVLAWLR